MKKKVVVTGNFPLPLDIGAEFSICHIPSPSSYEDILIHLADAWGYVLGGPEYLSKYVLKSAPKLKNVVVMGTGTPSFVDLSAASLLGVNVYNTPHINAAAVAEFGIATIISCLAGIYSSIDGVRDGTSWQQSPRLSLKNANILLVGAGEIGFQLIRTLRLLGAKNIKYFSRTRKQKLETEFSPAFVPLAEGLAWADLASIQVTYNVESHGLISDNMFAAANPNLRLINFSNPAVVDPAALRRWLLLHEQAFAFIDGYYREWTANHGLKNDSYELLSLPRRKFVATSHIAAQEQEAIKDILFIAFSKLRSQQ